MGGDGRGVISDARVYNKLISGDLRVHTSRLVMYTSFASVFQQISFTVHMSLLCGFQAAPEVPQLSSDPVSPAKMSQLVTRTATDAALLHHIVVDLPGAAQRPISGASGHTALLQGPFQEGRIGGRLSRRGRISRAGDDACQPSKKFRKLPAAGADCRLRYLTDCNLVVGLK